MSSRITPFLSLSLALVLSSLALKTAEARNLAVLVGVNDYYQGDVPDLRFCADDAQAIYKQLTLNCGYDPADVLLMHDQYERDKRHLWPERGNLETQIKRWLARSSEDDTVLFFFSGHGFLDEDRGILAPADFEPGKPAATGLRTADLKQWLLDCPARRKFLILDCCHAGAAKGSKDASQPLGAELGGDKVDAREIRIPDDKRRAFFASEGLVVLASCTENELSQEWTEEEQGLFTYFLARGLSGAADLDKDRIVNHLELFQYVVSKVTSTAVQEFNADQTPVMFHHEDAKGLFQLATVRHIPSPDDIYVPPADLAPSVAATSVPRQPDELAREAFRRLLGKKGLDQSRLEDARTLVVEAQRLRVSEQDEAGTNPFLNPYFTSERAREVYQWLQLAEEELLRQNAEIPDSLRISLALAAWHQSEADFQVAADKIRELNPLYPFEQDTDAGQAQARLLMMHAMTQQNSHHERLGALESYVRILDIIEHHERSTKRKLRADLVTQHVIQPAQDLAERIAEQTESRIDAETKRRIARVYGEFGDLIQENGFFHQNEEARVAFTKAISFDDRNPDYHVGLGVVELQSDRPDYQSARSIAFRALELGSSDVNLNNAIAHRLIGDAWFRESRELRGDSLTTRVNYLHQAVESYNTAIEAFHSMPVDQLGRFGSRSFGDCFLSRSAAYVELANFRGAQAKDQLDLLERASADAKRAGEIDQSRGYQAWMALGNAFEDQAWIGGRVQLYERAIDAFTEAKGLRFESPKPWLFRGRCQYKRAIYGGEAGYLEEAIRDLNYSLQLEPLPEAHYWLAQVHLRRNEFEQGDRALGEAVDLILTSGNNNTDYDRGVYLRDWAELALNDATRMLSEHPVDGAAVRRRLKAAEARTRELTRFDELASTIITAKLSETEAKLLGLQGKSAEQAAVLKDVLSVYSDLLRRPDDDLKRGERVLILTRCSELILTSSLARSNPRETLPLAISRADEAVRLAEQPQDRGMALYWASVARILAATSNEFPELLDSYLQDATHKLRDALSMAHDHDRSWEWSSRLGQLLAFEAKRLIRQGESARAQQLILEGCERFQFARERCPVEEEQKSIESQWRELYRLRQ